MVTWTCLWYYRWGESDAMKADLPLLSKYDLTIYCTLRECIAAAVLKMKLHKVGLKSQFLATITLP